MGRKWTKTRVLILAAVIGLIAAILYITIPKEPPKTPTAVALVAIPQFTIVTPGMVAMEERDLASEDINHSPALQKGRKPVELADVVGKVVLAEIRPGSEMIRSQLRPAVFSDNVEWKVKGGQRVYKRAVSVAVDAVISVGGFAQPGDRVDVVATYTRGDQPFTQTILQNVKLLAVGPDVRSKVKDDGETSQPDRKTAVLSVWPDQAQSLTSWENQGKLRLILRNPNDSNTVDLDPTAAPPVTVKQVYKNPSQTNKIYDKKRPEDTGGGGKTTPPLPVPAPTIVVWTGNVRTVVPVDY